MNTPAPVLPDTDTGTSEEVIAGIGDNNPPAFDQEVFDKAVANFDEFMEANKIWLNLKVIETKEHADKATDMVAGLRLLWKKIDNARAGQKKPHDTAGKAVQAAFSPYLVKSKTAADRMKPMLATYLAKEQAKAEAEQRKAEAAAAEKQRLAELKAAEALKDNDVSAQIDAEQALKEAEKETKAAAKPVKVKTGSATGAGRTISIHTTRIAEPENLLKLFLWYRDNPEVSTVLLRLANADIRNKDVDETKIPGIRIVETKSAA